jgi:FAD/FMN-containing dehydrogenase
MRMTSRSLSVVDVDAQKKTTRKKVASAAVARTAVSKKSSQIPSPSPILIPNAVIAIAPKKRKPVVKKRFSKTSVKKVTPKLKNTNKKSSIATHKETHAHPPLPFTLTRAELARKKEPLGHLLVAKLLHEAGFHGGVSSNKDILDRYSNDESIFTVRPQIVLQPKSRKDVEIAVSVLGKQTLRFPSLSLTPRAAGTGLGGGALTDSIVIDVSVHMHRIEPIHKTKDGFTVTCEPGAMWRDVEKKLKTYGVYLPSAPASKDICSIGGSVANNAAGPDSLRFGHTANSIESLDVVFYDGKTYTLKPITYKEYESIIKKDNAHARILQEVFTLIEKNETLIKKAKPKTSKNSAGYALWDVLSTDVAQFKKGHGTLDLTRLVCGSQGTIGVITSVTMRTEKIPKHTQLVVVPVFDLADAGHAIVKALDFNPISIELFDGLTFDLALKNPDFFKDRLSALAYYQVLLSMYTTYHVRYLRKTPEFTLLITLDTASEAARTHNPQHLVSLLKKNGAKKARLVTSPTETEMFWQIRRASYPLSKFQDPHKRPAAFLEDMVVPPKNLPKFFMEIKRLLKKYNVTACIHGHGGNGHLHFYPLIDFENKTTPKLITKMTEEFFATAIKYEGTLCGEHNDSIISMQHLSKMFNKEAIALFERLEHICDPEDIFNPGKKVHPRFDVLSSIRHTNNNAGPKKKSRW